MLAKRSIYPRIKSRSREKNISLKPRRIGLGGCPATSILVSHRRMGKMEHGGGIGGLEKMRRHSVPPPYFGCVHHTLVEKTKVNGEVNSRRVRIESPPEVVEIVPETTTFIFEDMEKCENLEDEEVELPRGERNAYGTMVVTSVTIKGGFDEKACIVNDYRVLKPCGKRSWIVQDVVSKQEFIMKLFSRKDESTKEELRILSIISHPNLVKTIEVLDDPRQPYIFVVLEKLEPLVDVLRKHRMKKETVQVFFRDLALAVAYLHGTDRKFVHRNIKPESLFLQKPVEHPPSADTKRIQDDEDDEDVDIYSKCTLKLGSFGQARSFMFQELDSFEDVCGTPLFFSPELISVSKTLYARKADVWALGVVLCELLFGKTPFGGSTKRELYHSIKFDDVMVPLSVLDCGVLKVLKGVLEKNPMKRMSIKDVVKMSGEWIGEVRREMVLL